MARARKVSRRRSTPVTSRRRAALEEVLDLFREWGRQGGRKRAKRLSPESRQKIARKAAQARWKKEKEGPARG